MAKIVGAMDVSGNSEAGFKMFLAIVIGFDEHIRSVVKATGYEHIHMRAMNKKDQELVKNRLKFNQKECVILCVKIDKTHIVDKFVEEKKIKKQSVVHKRVMRAYNRLVFKEIRGTLEDFLHKHGLSILDVVFECDSDCIEFTKDVGLRHSHIKKGSRVEAHMVADATAWLNNRGIDLDNTIWMDVTERVETRLINNFSK